jgi:hypothetical protein
MQWKLLSMAGHRYKERTSIDVGLERFTIGQREHLRDHNHLTIKLIVLSGDNDGRDCERWEESRDPIVIEKTEGVCNLVDLVL